MSTRIDCDYPDLNVQHGHWGECPCEHPILFQGWKVKKILKWDFDAQDDMQTRRVIKNPARLEGLMLEGEEPEWCPYGKPGDRLWVRETFYHHGKWGKNGKTKTGKQAWKFKATKHDEGEDVRFMDNPPEIVRPNKYRKTGWYKRPSIFMPRWASRILLEVTDVRVERVQEIMEIDARAEGCRYDDCNHLDPHGFSAKDRFQTLWDSINAKRGFGWDVNPWVWCVSFKRIKP